MRDRLRVSSVNVKEYQHALENLRAHLEDLVKMTRRYPVVCSFGGFHVIFTSREDIEAFIAHLDRALAEFNRAA